MAAQASALSTHSLLSSAATVSSDHSKATDETDASKPVLQAFEAARALHLYVCVRLPFV